MDLSKSYFAQIRTYFSMQHIKAAVFFCHESHAIESQYNGLYNDGLASKNLAFVTNAILSTVCFLEATINEFFLDTLENQERIIKLGAERIETLSNHWMLDEPRIASYPILDKYQKALELVGCSKLNAGQTPFQDVALLIKLRNRLIHYEPNWRSCTIFDGAETMKKFEKGLIDKFEISNFYANTANPFFPYKCLGFGCAKWAIENSTRFVGEFYNEIELDIPYRHIDLSIPNSF